MIATEAVSGRKIVLSWETTPDIEIALACRASASIPGLLAPVDVPATLLGLPRTRGTIRLVDGGMIDNIPVEQATDPSRRLIPGYDLGHDGQDLSTLVFVFDESGEDVSPFSQPQNSYAGRTYRPRVVDYVVRDHALSRFGWVTPSIHNTVTKYDRLENIRKKFSMRNVAIKVDGVKTTDFKKAKKLAAVLIENGKRQTMEYLNLHGDGEWTYESFNTPEEMLRDVPIGKLEQLIGEGTTNVFGIDLGRIVHDRSIVVEPEHPLVAPACRYSFNRGGHKIDRTLTFLDDAGFVADIITRFPPRREISDKPIQDRVPVGAILECFQAPLRFGRGVKIGEYTSLDFAQMKRLIDIKLFRTTGPAPSDRIVARDKDGEVVYTFSRELATDICRKFDAVGLSVLEAT